MTSQSQRIILTALREQRRQNSIRMSVIRIEGRDFDPDGDQELNDCFVLDHAIEIALQEIAVAE